MQSFKMVNILVCIVNFQDNDKVCSISQIYLVKETFKNIILWNKFSME